MSFKRHFLRSVGILFILAALSACGSKEITPSGQDLGCVPDWIINPLSAEDAIYGSGQAKMRLPSLSQQTADGNARNEIALSIQVRVESMLKTFMQESGIENAQALNFAQSVSKQVAAETLNFSKIEKRHICPDGTYYSLAVLPLGASQKLKETLLKNAANAIHNEEALYNEFKAKNALDELTKEVDRLELKKS